MHRSSTILALIPLLAAAVLAEAPSLDKTVSIGAGAGMQRYDGSFGDNATPYIRGILAYHPTEWLGTRFTGGYGGLEATSDAGQSFKTEWFSNLGLDLVLQPRMGLGIVRPYIASGLSTTFGTAKIDGATSQQLDWNYYVPVELGLEFLVAPNLSVWAWGETYATMKEWDKLEGVASSGTYWERRDDLMKAGIGFSFFIGAKSDADADGVLDGQDRCSGTPKDVKIDEFGCPLDGDKDRVADFKDRCPSTPSGAAVDADGCTVDSDKDGVIDGSDKCANTARGVMVDDQGCPFAILDADKDGVPDATDKCPGSLAGSKVNAVGCALDSDADGVGDDIDKCANTPAGSKVDASGCLLPVADADKDGISDALDKCPGTRAGVVVDSNGCTAIVLVSGAKLIMDGIVFKFNSAEIDGVSAPVLGRAAVALANAPKAVVEIAGHTDNVGSDAYNRKLSERRAASVKAFLVKSGTPSSQLTVKGYGESDPVEANTDEAGRSLNRRIEFRVK
jgi:outer membrane protein OmpA-like peptidoglycan-associated protein